MSGIETAEVRRNKSVKTGDGRAWELWWRGAPIATSAEPKYLRQYAKLNGWDVVKSERAP